MPSKQIINKAVKLNFWIGNNPVKGKILEGRPYQILNLTEKTPKGNMVYFKLDKPFPVVKGKKYRFQFGQHPDSDEGSYFLGGSFKNNYPYGEIYFHDGFSKSNRDLYFSINIASPKVNYSVNE